MAHDLSLLPSFSASWTSASAEDDLGRWAAFLSASGVAWAVTDQERRLIRDLTARPSARAAEAIEMRLVGLAHDVLKKAGDPRRLQRLVGSERRWYLLSAEQRSLLVRDGHRFEAAPSPLAMLATLPITLGAYFDTSWACRQAGLSPQLAWVVALVVYVITVRLVRGRWPLQPS